MRPAVGSWRPDGAATNRGAMAARSKKPTGGRRQAIDADAVVAEYAAWLGRQPLAGRSRDAYLAQMRGFLTWLASSEHGGAALAEPGVRDRAVRDYKRHVQTARHWAPSPVNQALAAIDSFYRSIGVGRPEVAREELARVAPRALAKADQRRFLRAVEGCPSARDRAIATVLFYTGLRLSELAATVAVLDGEQGRVRAAPVGGAESAASGRSRSSRPAAGYSPSAHAGSGGWLRPVGDPLPLHPAATCLRR